MKKLADLFLASAVWLGTLFGHIWNAIKRIRKL